MKGLRRLAPLHLIAQALEPRPRSAHARVASLEASLYMRNQLLRDTDWASMAHALEVRVPLVDAHAVTEGRAARWARLATSGATSPKASLALSPSTPLPAAVVARAKTGFTTPIARWLQTDGLPTFQDGRAAAQGAAHRTLVAAMGGAARGRVRCASLPFSPMASAPVAASPGTTRT